MMTFAKEIAVWMVLWIGGCVVFDALLGLTGGWLMLGGVITYEICSVVQDRMRSNERANPAGAALSRQSGVAQRSEG